MWEQRDCDNYLKTSAVLQVYIDQSISTNTFYNPAFFPDRKVPTTLIAKNLMQAQIWGIKTFYYSLINKKGAKVEEGEDVVKFVNGYKVNNLPESFTQNDVNGFEDDCEACKL